MHLRFILFYICSILLKSKVLKDNYFNDYSYPINDILRQSLIGYASLIEYAPDRPTVTNFREKETTAKRQPSCENPYIKRSDGSNPIVALYQIRA